MKLMKVKSRRLGVNEAALYRVRRGDAFQPWAEARVYIKVNTDRVARAGMVYKKRRVLCQPLGGGRSRRFSIAHRVYRRRDLCVCPISEVK